MNIDAKKVSIKFFLLSKTQKQKVLQDISLCENVQILHQSDPTCKGIQIFCSLQFSWSFCQMDSSLSLKTKHNIIFLKRAISMKLPSEIATEGAVGSWLEFLPWTHSVATILSLFLI